MNDALIDMRKLHTILNHLKGLEDEDRLPTPMHVLATQLDMSPNAIRETLKRAKLWLGVRVRSSRRGVEAVESVGVLEGLEGAEAQDSSAA